MIENLTIANLARANSQNTILAKKEFSYCEFFCECKFRGMANLASRNSEVVSAYWVVVNLTSESFASANLVMVNLTVANSAKENSVSAI